MVFKKSFTLLVATGTTPFFVAVPIISENHCSRPKVYTFGTFAKKQILHIFRIFRIFLLIYVQDCSCIFIVRVYLHVIAVFIIIQGYIFTFIAGFITQGGTKKCLCVPLDKVILQCTF